MDNRSDSPVTVITGGGRGMGAAIARELTGRGYRVALMSPSESAKVLAGELGGIGVVGSTASAEDLRNLVDTAMASFGRIDAVVNNTGHPPTGKLLDIEDDVWVKGNEAILLSIQRMAKLVTPTMVEQGGGAFLNVTTLATFEPDADYPISCAYRAAVAAYTKMYSDLYGPRNIRMNSILPGYIDSMNHTEAVSGQIPLRRIGSVAEIAKTAAFLLSSDAGYITGQNLRVDGGLTRHM
ncbi:SDR family oxidoreductase [Sinorhizobium meliloti]|uniref:SDR family oxidoreductase n=1 Tax=Rhizobium meliloti TaxID=382 RepID=UPI000FD6F283|nr:SDR family oxidoreductase [Sinorhizobium meliloti]RVI99542.1 SDR family oxidoreductase [Sinorhizobium meliloti]